MVDPVEEGLDLAGAGVGPGVVERGGPAEPPLGEVEPPPGVGLGLGPVAVAAGERLDGPLEEPGEPVEPVGLGRSEPAGPAPAGERAGGGAGGLGELGRGEPEPVGRGGGEPALDAGDGVGRGPGATASAAVRGRRPRDQPWGAIGVMAPSGAEG